MQSGSRSPSQRIPTLDGWRGVAILMVLGDHFSSALVTEQRLPGWALHIGTHGVALFFVLSGFLITSRLLDEQDRTGEIRLAAFYWRRAVRILPTAWLFLGLLALLAWRHPPLNFWPDLRSCVFSFRNYVDTPPQHTYTQHFWSLSIEEQFYLVWPSLLLFAGRRRARWIAAAGAVSVAAWRLAHWDELMRSPVSVMLRTQYWADALLVGCLTALFLPTLRPFLRRWMVWPLSVYIAACALHYHVLCPLHEALGMALLLAVTSQVGPRALLEWKPLAWLGSISYSIYIWQQFFTLFVQQRWSGLADALIALAPTVLVSYYLVEKPLIEFGRRLSRPRASVAPQAVVGQLATD